MNDRLQAKLKTLPRSPGVYFHKAKSGEVIYVGKAAVLKNRVRQYFQASRPLDIKTQALVAEIDDTDWIETESEIDALFFESEMIKRYMPRYNILLRDDKSQLYVRIDMKSQWPHVDFTRGPLDDGAEYYGPFYNGYAVKKALRYLRKTFPYYTKPPKDGQRPSLDAHLGLEPYGLTSEQYKAELRKLISYIKGNRAQLVRELERDMKTAAGVHDFERAAQLRNRLKNLRELKRRIMFGDREFLNISKDRALSDLAALLRLPEVPVRIEGFDVSHISGSDVVASMVVFSNGVSDRSNYRKFKAKQQTNNDTHNIYETVLRRLSPKNLASWGTPNLLLIDGGKPQLEAALRALDERGVDIPTVSIAKREEELVVHATRSRVDVSAIELLRTTHDPSVYIERSGDFLVVNLHPGQRNAGSHSKNLRGSDTHARYSDVVKLFQRIRDESHRFAISYHSTLRRKRQIANALEDIPGIGPTTRRTLLKTFGSVRRLQSAPYAEVEAAVGKQRAELLKRHLFAKRDD